MTPAERVGRNIRRIRRGFADLTQEECAARAEIARSSLALYERGVRLPSTEPLLKVAGALEVEPGALLEDVRWVPGEAGPGAFVV
jgi:transcriptional regulator with XRE-family HTH domain